MLFTFSTQPLFIFKVIIEGFKLFSHTFSKIWYWSFLFHFINSIPNILLFLKGNATPQSMSIGTSIAFLIAFIVQIYGAVFLMHRVYALAVDHNRQAMDSFLIAKEKLLPAVLATLILIGVIISNLMVFGFIAKVLHLGGILSALLIVPPIIFFSILLLFYLPFILFAGESAIEALKKSGFLVWGYWWETLLIPLTSSIISLFLIFFMLLIQPGNSLGSILSMTVISSFLAPLTYSLILVQYHNLRLLRNQKGLLD